MITKKLARIVTTVAVAVSTIIVAAPANAGLVWFSRANCANNESITWDWPGNNHTLWTNSFHYDTRVRAWEPPPTIRTGWEWGYRSGAVHWWEGLKGGRQVTGHHFAYSWPYGEYLLGRTYATGCNIGFFFPYW